MKADYGPPWRVGIFPVNPCLCMKADYGSPWRVGFLFTIILLIFCQPVPLYEGGLWFTLAGGSLFPSGCEGFFLLLTRAFVRRRITIHLGGWAPLFLIFTGYMTRTSYRGGLGAHCAVSPAGPFYRPPVPLYEGWTTWSSLAGGKLPS